MILEPDSLDDLRELFSVGFVFLVELGDPLAVIYNSLDPAFIIEIRSELFTETGIVVSEGANSQKILSGEVY